MVVSMVVWMAARLAAYWAVPWVRLKVVDSVVVMVALMAER